MAASTDLFARRNRARIVAVVVIAACNYVLSVALAAVGVALSLVLLAIFKLDIWPDSVEVLELMGYGIGGICALAFAVGFFAALVRIPFARRNLERRVLEETGATVIADDAHREVRNLLEGLAIAAGITPPRYAVIDDAAPNSFGVGTKPKDAIVAVTTGLCDELSRDEVEAVLAYEITRIRSYDVALASWTVALTGGAISALDSDGGLVSGIVGFVPRRVADWLQVWALHDQGIERDRAAVRFTRNPAALLRALERLDADTTDVGHVTRATAPLWIEFPARVLADSPTRATRRLCSHCSSTSASPRFARSPTSRRSTAPRPPDAPHVGRPRRSTLAVEHRSLPPDAWDGGDSGTDQRMCRPEMLRAMTRRWISEVPSKIV